MEQIYLMSTRFMSCFGDVIFAWLLLENAIAATKELANPERAYDSDFYEGKIYSAKYFFNNTLRQLDSKLAAIAEIDDDFKAINNSNFVQHQ